jgi:CDP-glucose 4,6-dehydratase
MFDNIYKNKKVFITGHTGFKGSWLTKWLLKLGASVKGYSLYLPSNPCLFTTLELENQIDHVVGDVRNYEQLKKEIDVFNPDFVFHLAAQAIVIRSFNEPKHTFETNLIGTINVLDAIRSNQSIKVGVFITSDKCYENVEWEYGYREQDQLGGKDPYSASKACAEIAISSYFRSFFKSMDNIQIASTRAGNVIGGGDWADNRIVPDCVRSWSKNNTVTIRSPYATRPWQHVLEPLSGYLWLGSQLFQQKENINGEAFNFGPNADVVKTVSELLTHMNTKWSNAKWKVHDNINVNHNEAGLLKLNCDKALFRINWESSLSFDETIDLTIGWYKVFYQNGNINNFTDDQINLYQELAAKRDRIWAQ